jgi:hypothetical protein
MRITLAVRIVVLFVVVIAPLPTPIKRIKNADATHVSGGLKTGKILWE